GDRVIQFHVGEAFVEGQGQDVVLMAIGLLHAQHVGVELGWHGHSAQPQVGEPQLGHAQGRLLTGNLQVEQGLAHRSCSLAGHWDPTTSRATSLSFLPDRLESSRNKSNASSALQRWRAMRTPWAWRITSRVTSASRSWALSLSTAPKGLALASTT